MVKPGVDGGLGLRNIKSINNAVLVKRLLESPFGGHVDSKHECVWNGRGSAQ